MDWPAPLTVREVAAELGCSVDEVRRLIRDGELNTVACGIRPGLVPRHVLDGYLRRHRVASTAAVAEVDDAVAECARLEQLEVDTSVVREEGFASAERHGVDEHVVLVDEPVCCESRGQVCAAHGDRPTVLFLERLNRLHGIGAGEARISLDCLERLREDELR